MPLTLEDVLHPEVGDIIVQSDPHDSDLATSRPCSRRGSRTIRTAVVLSDCQVDFNIPGVKPLCPDLAVFFGVRRRIEWSSFNVAEEGAQAGPGGRGDLARDASQRRRDQGGVLPPGRGALVRHRRCQLRRGGPAADRVDPLSLAA